MPKLGSIFSQIALSASVVCVMPIDGRTAVVPMGSLSQWSVNRVIDIAAPYCSLEWDGELGEKVEIRARLKNIELFITDTAWNLPDRQSTRIVIRGRKRAIAALAVAIDRTTLQLVTSDENADLIRSIVQSAVKGTTDIELSFAGNEPDWTVPISRIYPMHDAVTLCLRKLSKPDVFKDTQSPAQPF